MRRVNTPEILDSDSCPPEEIAASLRDISRINRWFGGVATTRRLIERVACATGRKHFSLLEVAAGFGEVPKIVTQQLARKGITLDITYLDRAKSHLLKDDAAVVADALALPFRDGSFDLVSSSLFAHHLEPHALLLFGREALRVSRCAMLINDLIRSPIHLALVYFGLPLMRSYVSRFDGPVSVRKAYLLEEMQEIISSITPGGARVDLSSHFLFRVGAIVWNAGEAETLELGSTGQPAEAVLT